MRQEYTINASRRPGPSSFALLLLLLLSPRRRRRRRCRPCRRRRPHPPKLMTKVFSSIVTRRCHRRRRHRRRRWHGFGPYNSRRVLMFLPGFSAHEATPALSKLYWSTFNHARGQHPGTYVRDVAKCTRREHHNLPCPTSGSCAALPIELSLATTGSDFWDVPEIGRSAFQRTYELLMLAFCVEYMVETRRCRRRRGHHRHGRRGCGRCCLLVVSPCTLLSHACL